MKNMKISAKLIVSFLIVIAATLIVGGVGIFGMLTMNSEADDIYYKNLVPIEALGNIREAFATQRNDIRNIFLNLSDPSTIQSTIQKVRESDSKILEEFDLYESGITNREEETGYYKAKEAWLTPFANMKNTLYSQLNAEDFDAAYQTFVDGAVDCIIPITEGLAEATEYKDSYAFNINQQTTKQSEQLTWALSAVILIAVAVALFLAFYISKLISKPVNVLTNFMKKAGSTGDITLSQEDIQVIGECSKIRDEIGQCISASAGFVNHIINISDTLEKVSEGDLTVDVVTLSDRDKIGMSMKRTVENLNSMFIEINESASQVTTGSNQIADGAQSLASGSTEQAATLEELSASIQDIADKTKENADRTNTASRLADSIMQNAEKGNRQMEQMITAVNEINQANQNISKVIKAIDDIAFQTNILALNAAVEAARAGNAGKGFAVVADEVRNLAAKSADSAKETGSLIANSMEKAQLGTQIAGETARSLEEIVSGISESGKIIAEIARSSDEQTAAIGQINIAVSGVTQVVQQNSATAEESAAASEEMSGQAQLLESLITKFKLA